MPVLAHLDYTKAAIADICAQTVPVRLLIINQGVENSFREELERIAEADDRIFLWSHVPPLPSLSATWNHALDFVWDVGGDVALVVNNDVRLEPTTIQHLRLAMETEGALFVSAVGVTSEQYANHRGVDLLAHGGPDFSCFLIANSCHQQYRFDEGFTPAYCEDLDYHRRLLLAGDGPQIFSVNLPYLHYGAATLKTVDPKMREGIDRAIAAGSRQHYLRKWGGPVNHECFLEPFKGVSAVTDGSATTPYLQSHHPFDRLRDVIDPRD